MTPTVRNSFSRPAPAFYPPSPSHHAPALGAAGHRREGM